MDKLPSITRKEPLFLEFSTKAIEWLKKKLAHSDKWLQVCEAIIEVCMLKNKMGFVDDKPCKFVAEMKG